MYRVTFTCLIAVSLLLVFVHSRPGFGDEDVPDVDGDINTPPNRLSASSDVRTNSQIQVKNTVIKTHPPLRINKGGDAAKGNAQTQGGDNTNIDTSGGKGGRGGRVVGTGGQNIGGKGGEGNSQTQGGTGSVIKNTGGDGGDGGDVLGPQPSFPSSQSITNIENSVSANKRDITASSSINSGPSFPGQSVGGRGGDGNIQAQGGSNTVSGGNGGPGGSVFASRLSFPAGFPFNQHTTNIENSVSANKRDFIASSSINSFPSFPGQNVGGRGGDGHVQVQGGGFNVVSGGNGGAGGNVFGPQPGFQSLTNIENSVSTNKRELGSGKNVSRVD